MNSVLSSCNATQPDWQQVANPLSFLAENGVTFDFLIAVKHGEQLN